MKAIITINTVDQVTISYKMSGVSVSLDLLEIANDIPALQGVLRLVLKGTLRHCDEKFTESLNDLIDNLGEYSNIIEMFIDWLRLIEGLNYTFTMDIDIDGKVTMDYSAMLLNLDIVKLLALYRKVYAHFNADLVD